MKKPIIAVDIDDVLVAEAAAIVEYSNIHWGTGLTVADYRENWNEMWPVPAEEFESRVARLHAPGRQVSYPLIDGAAKALRVLKKNYELVVLTSRREVIKQETLDWLEAIFPDTFSAVYFTNFWDADVTDQHLLTKGQLAQEIGANYLIDDQPRHCFAAAEHGVEALLFDSYDTKKDLELPPHVTLCRNWSAVLGYFAHIE